jgi:hypothetical protein
MSEQATAVPAGQEQAMLQDVLHAMRHGSVRDEWAAWLIYADWLEEEGQRAVHGEGLYGAPDQTITRAELARKIRAEVARERERTAAAGGRRDRSDLGLGYLDDDRLIDHVLTGEHVRWYV